MQNLYEALKNADVGLLPTLAQVWGVDANRLKPDELTLALADAMLDRSRVETQWDALSDQARGAMQLLIANQMKMPRKQFELTYGAIRKMGRGQIERVQPHKQPATPAEGLYYRGFIAEGFEQSKAGMRPIVYIPADLAERLPVHKTAYTDLQDMDDDLLLLDDDGEAGGTAGVFGLDDHEVENVQPTDTSLVDDMVTLLAYLRIHSANVEGDTLIADDQEALLPHMLKASDTRLTFLFAVGISAELITTQEGQAYPKRSGLQPWLQAKRSEQVRRLADAWRESTTYRDLWHVPGLYPDPQGFPYDMLVGREALINFIKDYAPLDQWWSLDDFIEVLKRVDPSFQRPGGDYDSWYIRNDAGEYLNGFESWDAVEGALLEYYLTGPMHWLGLVDLAEDAVRLTAYGRAFVGAMAWPSPPEQSENITVRDDGVLLVSRKVSRTDRFQVARFTSWRAGDDPYEYKLDASGLQQAAMQGINTQQISAFLGRHSGQLPPVVARLLDTWQGGAAGQATFERLLVLRTVSEEVLDRIYEEPSLRRYLGARLGPTAGIIRGDADALEQALDEIGLSVEVIE
jgi:hypothetical protein